MIYKANSNRMADRVWFANCCGATYSKVTPKTNTQGGHKGIKVWDGAIGTEYKGEKQSLTHVKTRNGTISVSIRHAW